MDHLTLPALPLRTPTISSVNILDVKKTTLTASSTFVQLVI